VKSVPTCIICNQRAVGKCPQLNQWFCGKDHQRVYNRLVLQDVRNKKLRKAKTTTKQLQQKVTKEEGSTMDDDAGISNDKEDNDDDDADEEEDTTVGKVVDVTSCRYNESELIVEGEPLEEVEEEEEYSNSSSSKTKKDANNQTLVDKLNKTSMFPNDTTISKTTKRTGDNDDDDDDDDDELLEQSDLNAMTGLHGAGGGTSDPVTMDFYTRIGRMSGEVKSQCLRYLRWPSASSSDTGAENEEEDGPLWISSQSCPSRRSSSSTNNDSTTTKDGMIPPPCEYCGAERKFEFQLMPQMIHFLIGSSSNNNNNSSSSGTGRNHPMLPLLRLMTKEMLMIILMMLSMLWINEGRHSWRHRI